MESLKGLVLSNKYELLEPIGTGGMAYVYKAKDIRLGRNVAVKVLKPEYNNDKEFIKRFQTESKAMAHMSHSNIVNVYDVGFEDDMNYIVMELIEGSTLKDYLQTLPGFMKEEAVINIAIQICSALSQAHSKEVVHRDIKAQNILIDIDGRIKVADFGIARAIGGTINKADDAFGSVHYASPEQVRVRRVDRRSDIYSLGILMYELLTRKVPFDGDTAVSVAMLQIKAPMPDPRDINPAVSKGLAKIIRIATRKKPTDRYQNAYEMISDLRKLKNNPEYIPIEKTIINNKEVLDDLLTEDDGMYNYEREESPTSRTGYLVSAVLGVALAVIISVFVLVHAISKKNEANIVTMPDILNVEVSECVDMLTDLGLKTDISEHRVDENVPKGHIISASIDAGEKLKKGYTVKLVVSDGGELVSVPKLTGLTEEKAVELLKREGFEIGEIKKEYSKKPLGYVISQEPSEGTMMHVGTIVDFSVSKGEEQKGVYVPSLSGITLKEAYAVLGKNNLEMGTINREYSDEYLEGVVISSERAGETVPEGTFINIVVSDGVDPATTTEESEEETTEEGETTTEEGQESSSEGEEETSEDGEEKTTTVTVDIKTEYFEPGQEDCEIRIELVIAENQHKEILYQNIHNKNEGAIIPITLDVTGTGWGGTLLVRYDTFVKDELKFYFDE